MIDSQLIQGSYCETLIFHFHILIRRTNLLLCFAAVLFVTSAPARLGESLHLGKHCQQRVSPRNYNSIRWGDYLICTLICTSILLFILNRIPQRSQSNLIFTSVFPSLQQFAQWNEIDLSCTSVPCLNSNNMFECSFTAFLYPGVVGPELTSTNVSIFITSDAGNSWREVQCDDRVHVLCHFSFLSGELVYILSYPGNFPLNFNVRQKTRLYLCIIRMRSRWTKQAMRLGFQCHLSVSLTEEIKNCSFDTQPCARHAYLWSAE